MITAVFVNLRRHVWRRQSLVPETTSHVLINIFCIKQTRHTLMLYTILFSLLYSIIKHKKMKMSKFSLKAGFRLTAVIWPWVKFMTHLLVTMTIWTKYEENSSSEGRKENNWCLSGDLNIRGLRDCESRLWGSYASQATQKGCNARTN